MDLNPDPGGPKNKRIRITNTALNKSGGCGVGKDVTVPFVRKSALEKEEKYDEKFKIYYP